MELGLLPNSTQSGGQPERHLCTPELIGRSMVQEDRTAKALNFNCRPRSHTVNLNHARSKQILCSVTRLATATELFLTVLKAATE